VEERQEKNDGEDALKLAQLSAMNQLTLVHVPEAAGCHCEADDRDESGLKLLCC
jgi:hypothetical protein